MNDSDPGDGVALLWGAHPREITPEMVKAGVEAFAGAGSMDDSVVVVAIYNAMCDAAPILPDDIDPDSTEEIEIEVLAPGKDAA